jgi:hypothetical protein
MDTRNFDLPNSAPLAALRQKRKRLSRGASPERQVKFLALAKYRLADGWLVFLLFGFLLRCHEGSSVNDFPLLLRDPNANCRPFLVWVASLTQDIAALWGQCQHNFARLFT